MSPEIRKTGLIEHLKSSKDKLLAKIPGFSIQRSLKWITETPNRKGAIFGIASGLVAVTEIEAIYFIQHPALLGEVFQNGFTSAKDDLLYIGVVYGVTCSGLAALGSAIGGLIEASRERTRRK